VAAAAKFSPLVGRRRAGQALLDPVCRGKQVRLAQVVYLGLIRDTDTHGDGTDEDAECRDLRRE
jgi:hypothetical protein